MTSTSGSLSDFEDGPSRPGLASLAFTAFTIAILLVLTGLVALSSLAGSDSRPRHAPGSASPVEDGFRPSNPRTVVYLVSSQQQGRALDDALEEWRLEIEALGTAAQEPRRVVVVQTREQVLRQRVIDFAILAAQAPGLDLEVVDLRD